MVFRFGQTSKIARFQKRCLYAQAASRKEPRQFKALANKYQPPTAELHSFGTTATKPEFNTLPSNYESSASTFSLPFASDPTLIVQAVFWRPPRPQINLIFSFLHPEHPSRTYPLQSLIHILKLQLRPFFRPPVNTPSLPLSAQFHQSPAINSNRLRFSLECTPRAVLALQRIRLLVFFNAHLPRPHFRQKEKDPLSRSFAQSQHRRRLRPRLWGGWW